MGIAIDEHGYRAQLQNRERGGERAHRRRQDFVARPAAEEAQRNLDGVQAAPDADRMRHAPQARQLFLEGGNLAAEHIPAAFADILKSGSQRAAELLPLTSEVVGEHS